MSTEQRLREDAREFFSRHAGQIGKAILHDDGKELQRLFAAFAAERDDNTWNRCISWVVGWLMTDVHRAQKSSFSASDIKAMLDRLLEKGKKPWPEEADVNK